MSTEKQNIIDLVESTLELLDKAVTTEIPDDFFEKLESRIDNDHIQVRVYSLGWNNFFRLAAMIVAIAVNVSVYRSYSSEQVDQSEAISSIVDDFGWGENTYNW